MFRSGAFVADHVEPTTDEQIQPNGVDLRLSAVYEQTSPGRIGRNGKEIGERRRRRADPTEGSDSTADAGVEGGAYYLPPGGYVIEYAETVSIPADHVGFIYPRSSLLRNSCMLNTAVWDPGYEGRGEGLLEVHRGIEIEAGARIAQFVLAAADGGAVYEGSYQGENLETERSG